MKKVLFTFLALFISVAVFAQQPEAEKTVQAGPRITFEESEYNFGDIHQGEKVEHIFTFENTGTEPLILSNVNVTCGCTATDWPRTPVVPGDTAQLKVTFNSTGKMGSQTKVVTVISNAVNSQERIRMVGNILPPKKEETK